MYYKIEIRLNWNNDEQERFKILDSRAVSSLKEAYDYVNAFLCKRYGGYFEMDWHEHEKGFYAAYGIVKDREEIVKDNYWYTGKPGEFNAWVDIEVTKWKNGKAVW